jgi:NAD-reducing hydrogenase large subunit
MDDVVGMSQDTLPSTALSMRRLMHYGQVLQSHALHFFYLAAPDLLLGVDSDVNNRNVVGLAAMNPELAKKGILLRKFGQEIILATAGKKIHGISAVPGGIHKHLTPEEIKKFEQGIDVPSVDTVIEWCEEILEIYKNYHAANKTWLDTFETLPSNYMSLVGKNGEMDLYHGNLRCITSTGQKIIDDIDYHNYLDYYSEEVKEWSYMKFPFIKQVGPENGWMRVGPLARVNVCDYIATPKAQKALEDFRSINGRFAHQTLNYHWARLIEMLHCAESIKDTLKDPSLLTGETFKTGVFSGEGIGFLEAPRGTLIHHYKVAESGAITKCNLIVSTTHNNTGMNLSVKNVAKRFIEGQTTITEGMLNHLEVAIRAYDPCLSCATHALGKMPLKLEIMKGDQLIASLEK